MPHLHRRNAALGFSYQAIVCWLQLVALVFASNGKTRVVLQLKFNSMLQEVSTAYYANVSFFE